MHVNCPEPMPEDGYSNDAWATGYCSATDQRMSYQQTLYISLFFDCANTNNAGGE